MTDLGFLIFTLLMFCIGIGIWFLPYAIAKSRNCQNKKHIFVLNWFCIIPVIGLILWIVLVVLAITDKVEK